MESTTLPTYRLPFVACEPSNRSVPKLSKRVLITARLYGAGGVETHLLNLCRLLVRNGAEITVVSRYAMGNVPLVRLAHDIPVRLITTPFAKNLKWFRLSTAWALLFWPILFGRRRFDVLYSLELSRFTRFLSWFVEDDGRVFWNRAGALAHEADNISSDVSEFLDGVIVESEVQATAVRAAYKLGVMVKAVPHLGHYESVPERRIKHGDEIRIAFLGRYDIAKGIYRLIDLWPQLKIGKARLEFRGHGVERDRLSEKISRLGLSHSIRVSGGWSEPRELSAIFEETDLVVLPSHEEGLPVILFEAMAHGVPFVATDVGAVRTLAENNPDILVVPNDDEAIKSGIQQMVAAIRSGEIDGRRLQKYHERHYGFEKVSELWTEALLNPEFFKGDLMCADSDPLFGFTRT